VRPGRRHPVMWSTKPSGRWRNQPEPERRLAGNAAGPTDFGKPIAAAVSSQSYAAAADRRSRSCAARINTDSSATGSASPAARARMYQTISSAVR
jgi:hypothetical protein